MNSTSAKPVWRQLLRLRQVAPTLFSTCLALVVAELVVIFVAPIFVPDHVYLRLYLSTDHKESFEAFLDDSSRIMVFDSVTGWSNRPAAQLGNWRVDQTGARVRDPSADGTSKSMKVIFLGSSLVNGGVALEFEDTISGYIEDSETEALNFGTMMYSLDQSYLSYKHRLHALDADVVVVGLSARPAPALENQYIPFRVPAETEMPFFKPRFELESGQMTMIEVPPESAQRRLLTDSALIESIQGTDRFYGRFSAFKRFGVLPLSASALHVATRARNFVRLVTGDDGTTDLLRALLAEMGRETEEHGARVVLLTLPSRQITATGGWRALLPDHYGRLIEDLEGEGIALLDAREPIRASGYGLDDIYGLDGIHFTALGNRVIAGALKELLDERFR